MERLIIVPCIFIKHTQLMWCIIRWYILYLPQLLQHCAQVFIVSLSIRGGGPAVLQLWLELQEAAHVVGLLGGRLLQQCLLVRFSIFCHLALGGVGLAKCLEQDRRGKIESSTWSGDEWSNISVRIHCLYWASSKECTTSLLKTICSMRSISKFIKNGWMDQWMDG